MIAITAAGGQLGQAIVHHIQTLTPTTPIVATVRNLETAPDFNADQVTIRHADFDQPDTLTPAFSGVQTLILVSLNEIGDARQRQHKTGIDAAKAAGVRHIIYTSVANADTIEMDMAEDHRQTEADLRESGLNYTILRNGWYFENFDGAILNAAHNGQAISASGDGRVSPALRDEYAQATARIALSPQDYTNAVLELFGSESFTLAELAQTVARLAHRDVEYTGADAQTVREILSPLGLPDSVLTLLVQADGAIKQGALTGDDTVLTQLLGHKTTDLDTYVSRVLNLS